MQDDRTGVDFEVSDKDGSVGSRQWKRVAKTAESGGRGLVMRRVGLMEVSNERQ